ncbi:hypothetical protein WA026_010480 [Henosepilachna vigintioctopunctata]|uniref:Uncharacterized protein n=1 Tax=Henosepilachna vigintioctopunctata TaxID=420089 RepID=A0AAW1VE95_9CUCU
MSEGYGSLASRSRSINGVHPLVLWKNDHHCPVSAADGNQNAAVCAICFKTPSKDLSLSADFIVYLNPLVATPTIRACSSVGPFVLPLTKKSRICSKSRTTPGCAFCQSFATDR